MDGDIGLRRLMRALSRPDFAAADSDDDELLGAGKFKRSGSQARGLRDIP
jgi:hypothetical protein